MFDVLRRMKNRQEICEVMAVSDDVLAASDVKNANLR